MAYNPAHDILPVQESKTVAPSPSPPLPLGDSSEARKFARRVRPHLMGILAALDELAGIQGDASQRVTCPDCGSRFSASGARLDKQARRDDGR